MPTYDLQFYNVDPTTIIPLGTAVSFIYTGPVTPTGTATITDGNTTLTDDGGGQNPVESGGATADVAIGGLTSNGSDVDAEHSWTFYDALTGQTFKVIAFEVEDGGAAGMYMVSEIPLVAGRDYEITEYDSYPSDAADGFDSEEYQDIDTYVEQLLPDGIVEGTAGADVIDASYIGDPELDRIDGAQSYTLAWTDVGTDEEDIGPTSALGVNTIEQTVGDIDVTITITDDGSLDEASVDTTDALYTESGEPFGSNSSLYLRGDGSASDTATIDIEFAATGGSNVENEVENVSFRLEDVDSGSFTDIFTITAVNAAGDPIEIIITPAGDDIVVEDPAFVYKITGVGSDGASTAGGSVLIEIPGPVASVTVDWDNGGTTVQGANITDINFDAIYLDNIVEAGDGDDIIDAGLGADVVYAGEGNDTVLVGDGDTIYGQDGDDTFTIDTANLTGTDEITIVGGEGDETTGDVLDFGTPGITSLTYTNTDDAAGGLSGTATLADGTIVTFSEIETLLNICFTPGVQILTPTGERPIEDIKRGDLVITRDNGPQPVHWIGRSVTPGLGKSAPICIPKGQLGNKRDILVSPQHRFVLTDHRAELYFGSSQVFTPAKHLVDLGQARWAPCQTVEYIHLMCDQHEVIFAEGAATESFFVSDLSVSALEEKVRQELFDVFPHLRADISHFGPTARRSVSRSELQLLG
jgi:hypothetical protein